MGIYKVLKDFPSRNGVRQYKAGQNIHLDDNSRTKALMEMGYIEAKLSTASLVERIALAITKLDGVTGVKVEPRGSAFGKRVYKISVKES